MDMSSKNFFGLIIFAIFCNTQSIAAESTPADPDNDNNSEISGKHYTPPSIDTKTSKSPGDYYPADLLRTNQEGWVQMQMMIDPSGKPYAITVVDSLGDTRLEAAAVQYLNTGIKFKPATIDGITVDAEKSLKVSFAIYGLKGTTDKFYNEFNSVKASLKNDEKSTTEAILSTMKPTNLYEESYYWFAHYNYYARWGTTENQLEALTKAVAHESRANYLPKEIFSAASKELFMLKIKTADLGGALALYDRMDKSLKKDADLTELAIEIKEIKTSDRAFSTKGKIKKFNTWSVALLKRKFNVALTSGTLAEIVLRCSAGYRLYNFEAGKIYEVPENYGDCTAELVGDEGSQFSFTQL